MFKGVTCFKSPFPKLRIGKDYDGGYIIADIPNVNYNIIIAGGLRKMLVLKKILLKNTKMLNALHMMEQ